MGLKALFYAPVNAGAAGVDLGKKPRALALPPLSSRLVGFNEFSRADSILDYGL